MPFATFPQPAPVAAAVTAAPAAQLFELPFTAPTDHVHGSSRHAEPRIESSSGPGFKQIIFTLLIGIGVVALIMWFNQSDLPSQGGGLSSLMRNPFKETGTQATRPVEAPSSQRTNPSPAVVEDVKPKKIAPPVAPMAEAPSANPEPIQAPALRSAPMQNAMGAVTTLQLPGSKNNPLKSREEKVGPKNTLSSVANRHYGAWNETVRDLIAAANPELGNLDNLPAGTRVQLPIYSREGLVVRDGQGRYFVYFGSFDKLEFARMNLDGIKRSFSGAELVPVDGAGVQLHRLFVGPFVSQGEAQAVANSLWFKYLPILN